MIAIGHGMLSGGSELLPASAPLNSEINVTPFVDVMLVLLIIFMVAAPMLTVGVPIDLPKAALDQLPPEEKPLDIFIEKNGLVSFADEPVPFEMMETRLAALDVKAREGRVRLRADMAVPYEKVMALVEALSKAGFSKIGLVAAPKAEGPSP
jgi:biopolymer transport protein TolR